ncbi:MAG: hypothetical protein Q9211_003186 [Gyalolechia sp. 1 TL-2023]
MSVPHTSSPRRCFQTSTGETLQPWDGGTQPVDQFCIKQEPSDKADTDGQDSPLASWHRQTLPRPQSHRKSNFQTVNQSRAFSSREIAQPSLSAATSESRHSAGDDTQPKDGDSSSSASDEDEDADGGEMNPQAAAERQAEQRKMKRFRLTHNQTRYLMSEYARQAHPGSAQRERLAREIPGLSPRQVQVWFQNRRAKLKRLSADDRESILKSRALPLDFDTTQALHYMHDTPSQVDATAIVHHNHDGYGMRRSNAVGRGWPIHTEVEMISPVSISTTSGDPYSTPGSLASGVFFPTSPSSELSHFFTPSISQGTSPRTQVQNVRPRAVSSSVLSMDATMAHMVDAATLSRPPSSGMSPQEPLSLYPQQDFLRRAILPNVPLDHDEPLDSLKHPVTGYYPYNRSHLINTAAYARRASGSVLLGGQDVSPVTMPVRPIQSAPLAKPPDSLTAQQSLQKQLIDGGPRSGSFYEQRPQNSNFWGPCTMSSDCQPEYTGHISDPPHFHPPPNGRHDASGEQETFEGWNG